MREVSAPTEKFHDFWNDPADTTVLRSNEGVFFRASGWRLAQASPWFAKWCAKRDETGEPTGVKVAATANVVDLFLQTIYAPRSALPACQAHDLFALFRLHFTYQTSSTQRVRLALEESEQNPWELLRSASALNDIPLGQAAIRRMDNVKMLGPLEFWSQVRLLRSKWQLSFIYAVFGAPLVGGGDTPMLEARRDWAASAADFNPPQLKYTSHVLAPPADAACDANGSATGGALDTSQPDPPSGPNANPGPMLKPDQTIRQEATPASSSSTLLFGPNSGSSGFLFTATPTTASWQMVPRRLESNGGNQAGPSKTSNGNSSSGLGSKTARDRPESSTPASQSTGQTPEKKPKLV